MTRRSWPASIVLAGAVLAPAPAVSAAARVVTIGYFYDGGVVDLAVGDELDVRVGSTPGTGYAWNVAMNDEAVLQPVGKPVDEKSQDVRPGAPGSRLFRFRAARSGTASLGLVYERPWEKDAAPARLFRVQALVEESAPSKPAALSEGDGGAKIFLEQGQTLSIRLPSNPAAGLGWVVTRSVPAMLKTSGEPRLELPENGEPGTPGSQVFEFTAVGSGAAALELSYRRAADKDKPAERVWTIFVAVAGVTAAK